MKDCLLLLALFATCQAFQGLDSLLELSTHVRKEFSSVGIEWSAFNLTARDGTKLWTVYLDLHKADAKVPTVVIRSPYGPEGTENLADLFLPFGFNVVEQNQRGTGQSEGNFTFWSTCPNDEQDTINWILNQSWSNGQVYIMGASADGINAVLAMREQQKELGQWLIFTLGEAYAAPFQGGALREHLTQKWLKGMQDYRPNAPSYYKDILLPHEGYSEWWSDRSLTNDKTITFPSIFWGGWYDIFLQPMIETFQAYDLKSSDDHHSRMVIGPRGHCLTPHPFLFPDDRYAEVWSYETALAIYTNQTLASDKLDSLHKAFEKYLGVDHYSSAKDLDRLTLYIMGPSRGAPPSKPDGLEAPEEEVTGMYWTTLPDFPEPSYRNFYLHDDNALRLTRPEASSVMSYKYDPANPVPTIAGNNLFGACGPADQRTVESRDDVLVFTTGPLIEDLAVVGRIRARLYVSSDQVDTDFTVKITDVYPLLKGRDSILVGDSIQRMRWRNGVDHNVTLMQKGEVYEVVIELWTTAYVFNRGHSIRLAVSSSNYPRFSATPNNGLPLVKNGTAYVANNSIHLGEAALELPVVSLDQIPKNVPLP